MHEIGYRSLFTEGSLRSIGSEVPGEFPTLTPIGPVRVPGVYAGVRYGEGTVEVMFEMENLQDMRYIEQKKKEKKIYSFEFYVAGAKDPIYSRSPSFMRRVFDYAIFGRN